MTRNERRRDRLLRGIMAAAALLLIGLCLVGAAACRARTSRETQAPESEDQTPILAAAIPAAEPQEPTDPLAELRSMSNVVEGCWITGYAPELIDGWKEEYRDCRGLYLTASGAWCAPGYTVATDPAVIPTGATVIIGERTYVAADRGVVGNVVDIMMSPEEAMVFGAWQTDVYWTMGEGETEE